VKKSLVRLSLVTLLLVGGVTTVLADGSLPMCTPDNPRPCGGGTASTK
jgi:hypothetical protein